MVQSHCCRVLAAAAAIALGGCATPLDQPISGYTCCNLRARDGWVSSNNVQGDDLVPLGEQVRLSSIKRRFYVYGEVGKRELGFRGDHASTQDDTMSWVRRIVVAEDPRQRLEAMPEAMRKAIVAARVVIGMTREQVAMAIGYPSSNDTPDLDGATWRYWTGRIDQPVDLHFAADGTLDQVIGKPAAVQTIEL